MRLWLDCWAELDCGAGFMGENGLWGDEGAGGGEKNLELEGRGRSYICGRSWIQEGRSWIREQSRKRGR